QCHPWLPPLSEFPLPGPLPSKSSPLLFTTSPANDKVQLAPTFAERPQMQIDALGPLAIQCGVMNLDYCCKI
ncbi:MAG: hypothetical protein ABSG68_22800, partial [Thermoguttaceae bacterium]